MIIGIYAVIGEDKAKLDANYQVSFYGNAFGVVALIALTPIIAIQILGVTMEFKQLRRRYAAYKSVTAADDAQVIHFN